MLYWRRFGSVLTRISDWFVPDQQGPDAESLHRRGRMLLVVVVLSLLNLGWTALYQLELGNETFALASAAVMPVALGVAAALRLGVSIRLLTIVQVALFYAVTLAITLGTAGRWAGGLFFLVLTPALAVLLVSRRSSLWWAGGTVLTIAVAGWLIDLGGDGVLMVVSDDAARSASFRTAALLTIAIAAVAYFYSSLYQRANDALRESVERYQQGERRFRAIAENAYDLIAELDAQGRVIYASPGFEEALGWSSADLIGRRVSNGLHPADVRRARTYWAQLLEKGGIRLEPLRFVTAGGGVRWLEISMRSHTAIGTSLRVVAIARDVTERLDREKLMRHQQNLVAVGTMAAGATHQLNSPISAIIASSQYARRFESQSEFPRIASETLASVEEEARRCSRILRAMLAFAREEKSERWVEDVNLVARRAVRAIEVQERPMTAEIVLSCCAETASVLMSPIEVEQALINLLRNAIQSDAKVVVVGTDVPDRDTVQITVSDDGVGIREDIRPDVFDPFVTTHPESGSGLGLSIAREIISDHDGSLCLLESSAEGSVFRIALPRAAVRL